MLLAYARLYDERGGAIEIDIKESKQGLGIAKRNKKSYGGQQMVMLLGQPAHNWYFWSSGRGAEEGAGRLSFWR